MDSSQQKSSFDELVAGISAGERKYLLDKLSSSSPETVIQPVNVSEEARDGLCDLKRRISTEPLIYRFFLWFRSLFVQSSVEEIYNGDMIASVARSINRAHPGIVDYPSSLLKSLFYEKLKELKISADFFRPYIDQVEDNPGKFYVFLSMFVAPEISTQINTEVDPYSLPFTREVTGELRASLLRKMDTVLKSISSGTRNSLYAAVKSFEWLRQFSELPYIHFISQFTAIVTDSYTCPYQNAQTDFPAFVRVLNNTVSIPNEVLESLFLFPQRKNAKTLDISSEMEKALQEYVSAAASKFSMIQMFITTIPMDSLGCVIFNDYNWQSGEFGGAEDWFSKYREEWKRIFDERWESWLRDRKKAQLSAVLKSQFDLDEFPELPYRPWADLWGGVTFSCELTGGFLVWFNRKLMADSLSVLKVIILEGAFVNTENRTQLSESLNDLSAVSQRLDILVDSLGPHGNYGAIFDKLQTEHIRSLQGQSRVDSILVTTESEIHEINVKFCAGCRSIEQVLRGLFDEDSSSGYKGLHNLMTIRGHDNRTFRDRVTGIRTSFINAQKILAEIEPIDLPRTVPVKK